MATEKKETQEKQEVENVADIDNEKAMAAIAYILFFVPMLAAKDSDFAMYHANQGFNLFLAGVAVWIGGIILTIVTFGIASPLVMLASLGILVLAVLGIINALNGEKKPLPLIGKYNFLKK